MPPITDPTSEAHVSPEQQAREERQAMAAMVEEEEGEMRKGSSPNPPLVTM